MPARAAVLQALCLLACACGAGAFLPMPARVQSNAMAVRAAGSAARAVPLYERSRLLVRAADSEEEEAAEEPLEEEKEAPAGTSGSVDDVFNSTPFLTKRKQALQKELDVIAEDLLQLDQQYKELDDDWGSKIEVMRKDYDMLKARYYNDTQEVSMAGKSTVFVELIGVVDDYERAKMAYKPQTEREKEIVDAYDRFKDEIVKAMLDAGMEEVPTIGHPFDFKMHDCMFTEMSMEYPEEYITREFSKGFLIGGKCIRPAKVACSTGPGP